MRWPLRIQFLVSVLAVVIVAIVGSSALSAYLAADWLQQRQQDNLARVIATLTDASFPLNESVLKKMTGLSGAEFIVLNSSGDVQGSSMAFSAGDIEFLRQLPRELRLADIGVGRVLELSAGRFLASRLAVNGRGDRDQSSTLVVLYPEQRWAVARRQVIYPPLIVGAVAGLLATAVAALLARRVVGPLERLRGRAAAIEQGDFRPVPLSPRNDEIQDLTRSINHMVERLAQYEADVRQNERLRTLGQLGAGIAHQVRNAATGARLALDLHEAECPLADSETVDVAVRQLTLIETYLKRFLTLGGRQQLAAEGPLRQPVDLRKLIDEALELIRPAAQHAGIELRFNRPPTPILVLGDVHSLIQMFVNLLTNGIEAAAGALNSVTPGELAAVAIELERSSDGRLECRIGDSGTGPAAAIADRLFDPFASDKPDGTGLGLAVCRQIADEHDARISWHRAASMTWFVVSFPEAVDVVPEATAHTAAPAAGLATNN